MAGVKEVISEFIYNKDDGWIYEKMISLQLSGIHPHKLHIEICKKQDYEQSYAKVESGMVLSGSLFVECQ